VPEAALPAISELLAKWSAGDREAFQALIPLLYDQLHQVAHRYLRKARPGHTLQTTALVHEAYLRLEEHHNAHFQNHCHFIAICALLMRQILIGHERTRRAAKRGAGAENLTLDDAHAVMKGRPIDLIALEDALNDLARLDPQQSRIIELRFFGGLSVDETARVMAVSPTTVKREWRSGRAWLHREMSRVGQT
jgi:RNA polymerase sigma factor (TIGR02999 family)